MHLQCKDLLPSISSLRCARNARFNGACSRAPFLPLHFSSSKCSSDHRDAIDATHRSNATHAARSEGAAALRTRVRRGLARRRGRHDTKANADAEAKEPGVESYNTLKKLANDFMQRRNKGDIAGIVKDLARRRRAFAGCDAVIK